MLVRRRDGGNEKELYIYKYKTRNNRIKCMHGLSRYAKKYIYQEYHKRKGVGGRLLSVRETLMMTVVYFL